jgi:putative membrane protein
MKRTIVSILIFVAALSAMAEAAKPTLSKDETVFAILDPTGKIESVYVSDWIHSEKAGALIHDRSSLSGIENVKGKEVPSRAGDELTWKLSGQDLYYRGTTTKALPLAVSVRYSLDGRAIGPAALAGKSGRVTVRVEVKNLAESFVGMGEKRHSIHAPLLVIVGADLPAATFSDIEIKNGKLLCDGQNNIVAGVLLPGLSSSLDSGYAAKSLASLGLGSLPIGEVFEFSADVHGFKLGPIMLAATPDMPAIGKGGASAKLSALMADLQKLGEASRQIREGSAALAAGAEQLHGGIKTASDGLAPLFAKKAQIQGALDFIGSDEDIAAARELVAEAQTLSASAPALIEAAGAALDPATMATLKKTMADARGINTRALIGSPLIGGLVSEQSLAAMAESMKASDELYKGLDEKKLAAAAELGKNTSALLAAEAGFVQKTAFLDEGEKLAALEDKLGSGTALSAEERAELKALIAASREERGAIAATGSDGGRIAALAGATSELSAAAPRIIEAKKAYAKNHLAFELARSFLAIKGKNGSFKAQLAGLEALQKDLGALEPLIARGEDFLDSEAAASILAPGGKPLDAAAAKRLAADIERVRPLLAMGSELMEPQNVAELRGAAARLPELESGLGQLESGSALLAEKLGELAKGTAQFDSDGIQRLVSAGTSAGSLALGLCQTADDLASAAADYRNFSGAPRGAATSLKFVLRTEEIH